MRIKFSKTIKYSVYVQVRASKICHFDIGHHEACMCTFNKQELIRNYCVVPRENWVKLRVGHFLSRLTVQCVHL